MPAANMPLPITELTSRAREIFRLVVEGYIASGQPVGSKTLAGRGRPQPVASLDPLGARRPRTARPARRAAYQRRADADRDRAQAVRRWHDARARTQRRGARRDRAAHGRSPARSSTRSPRPAPCCLTFRPALAWSWCRAANRQLAQLSLVPLAPDRALGRAGRARTARSRTAFCRCPDPAAGRARGSVELHHRARLPAGRWPMPPC